MALGKLVDRLGAPVANTAHASSGGTFLVRCGLLYRRGPGEADCLCIPAGSGLGTQVLRECHDGPLVGHFITARLEAISKRARWSDALPSGWARMSTWLSTCAGTKRISAPTPNAAAHEGSCITSRYRRDAAG